ncbi:hypothetical protein PF010_g27329, partial [Phytophthora fragariae]
MNETLCSLYASRLSARSALKSSRRRWNSRNTARDDDAPPLVVELAVEGMMCMQNCGSTVQRALRGVASAVVDFERRSARVECEPRARVTAADLVDAVECVGFGAAV